MEIEVQNISYKYPGSKAYAIEDFSHHFKNRVTLLKGFSGCGKSTFLRLIASLITPNSGRVTPHTRFKYGTNQYLRSHIGFVFQQLNLLPLASLERNIEIASKLSGYDPSEVSKWIKILGLEPFSKKSPKNLSGGQQQRAAIARAMVKKPAIILLDEPTSGLDDQNTTIIVNALKREITKDSICLIATHDSRLDNIADEILDFNTFLPVEEHLQALD
jgi:ABC-type lipoprotein export system ATPase subunit